VRIRPGEDPDYEQQEREHPCPVDCGMSFCDCEAEEPEYDGPQHDTWKEHDGIA
jgi:hypothetical protein